MRFFFPQISSGSRMSEVTGAESYKPHLGTVEIQLLWLWHFLKMNNWMRY